MLLTPFPEWKFGHYMRPRFWPCHDPDTIPAPNPDETIRQDDVMMLDMNVSRCQMSRTQPEKSRIAAASSRLGRIP